MFCPSHACAGIGVGDGEQQPDDAGREQNRIEHDVFSRIRVAECRGLSQIDAARTEN
jgi:hypothetical protein